MRALSFLSLGELLYEDLLQLRKPLFKRHIVASYRRRADVTTGRQNVVVSPDLLQRRGLAEARYVLVGVRVGLPAPSLVGSGDPSDILVRELLASAIDHVSELAGIDEQHLAAPIAPAIAKVLVACEEPQAGGDLGRIEELPWQGDHAIHHVALDHGAADVALAGLRRRHGAVGEHHTSRAVRGKMMVDVLEPRVVGVAYRGHPELPACVFPQPVTSPIGDVEGRIGKDEVGLEVL